MIFVESPTLLATFVQTPAEYDPNSRYPIVVGLHGFGSSAERFMGLATQFTSEGIVFAAMRAPYTFVYENGQLGYDWSLQHLRQPEPGDRARQLTIDYITTVLADLRAAYPVDRMFLLGFSQGGAFAYMTGIANHSSIDGLIALGSRFDASWFFDGMLTDGNELPVFIAHGESDEAIGIAAAERARDVLLSLGYDVTFLPFDAGHTVPGEVLAEVIAWMGKH